MRRLWKQETPEEKLARLRAACRKDVKKTIEKLLYITTAKPGAPLEHLKLNWSQNYVYDRFMQQEWNNKPVRAVILKSRQVGISTFCSAWIFVKTFFNQNVQSLIMGHEVKATQKLFEKQLVFNSNLPIELQLPLKRQNKQELYWQDYINCQITVATAGSPDAVRSTTTHHALFTEPGFYDYLEDLKAGMEPAIHPYPGTSIIWESTGKGFGTGFHKLVEATRTGDTQYDFIFLKWYEDPACAVERFVNARAQDAVLKPLFAKYPDLVERQKEFKLTPEQIAWYGLNLKDRYNGDQDRMSQEYPCTVEEAFLAGGKTIINAQLLAEIRKRCWQGRRYPVGRDGWKHFKDLSEDGLLRPNTDIYLEIWQDPIPGRHYLISADSAQGVATGDYSCAYIFDILTQHACGVLHGRIDPKTFAGMLARLGDCYNFAVVCPEIDGLGAWLLAELKDVYYNIYQARQDHGYITRVTNKLGFDMRAEKTTTIATMKTLLRDRYQERNLVPDEWLHKELVTFIDKDGKPQAQKGCHDDRVIAYAIGLKACFDEIQSRPDLTRLLLSTKTREDSTVKPRTDPDEIIRRLQNPDWIPGYQQLPQSDRSSADLGPLTPTELGDGWDWQW